MNLKNENYRTDVNTENNFLNSFANSKTNEEVSQMPLSCGFQIPQISMRQNCCCKKSMIEALKLLCDTELSELIDFEKFAFLTNTFIVGAKLVIAKLGTEDKDNLSNLDGEFKRFSPGNCDLIDIEGTAYYNLPLIVSITDLAEQMSMLIQQIIDIIGTNEGILGTAADLLKEVLKIFDPVDFSEELLQSILDFLLKFFTTIPKAETASICNLDAIAFEAKYAVSSASGDKTSLDIMECNYKRAKEIFICKLDKRCSSCGECKCNCDCDDCCCVNGVMEELFSSNLSKKATITAGNLTLRDVSVLGTKGNVLVFANDKKKRFYFVCADAIQFLA